MRDMKRLAMRQTILRAVQDALGAEVEAGKADLLDLMKDLHDAIGSKTFDVTLPDGKKVATLSLAMTNDAVKVSDREALLQWARENAPEFVYEVPAHLEVADKGLTEGLVFDEDGTAYTADGEEVPGVRMVKGGKVTHYATKFVPGGRQAIADAWSAGEFGRELPGMAPALPGGKGESDGA